MAQFGGSFRFVKLPAVTQLLADLSSTGRLCITHADWTGEIIVRDGQIVGAQLGAEQGRPALEAIAVALPDGEFSFADEPVAETSDVIVTAAERTAYLDRLGAEHQRLFKLIPSLGVVPRLVEVSDDTSTDARVTIGAAALQLIPALVLGHTVEQVARQRGLVRTLRELAELLEGGLVTLEQKPSVAPVPLVVEKAVAVVPTPIAQRLPARVVAARAPAAMRSVAVEESTQPAVAHQSAPRLSFARHSTPRPASPAVAAVRPSAAAVPPSVVTVPPGVVTVPPGVAARLSAVRNLTLQEPSPTPERERVAAWRKAIVSFFLNAEVPDVV